MRLTNEQLIELIELIADHPPALRPNERRTQVRVGLRYRLGIRKLLDQSGLGARQMVFLRDLSVGGVGLSANFRLREGEGFVIELPRADASQSEIICLVTHVKSMPGGVFHIGGRFMAPFEQRPRARRKNAARQQA